MEEIQQAQTFRIPFHFNFPVMSQSNSLKTRFQTPYQKDFTQFAYLKRINSRRMEEEHEKPLSISSSCRKSFPKKRTYNKKNKSPNHNHGRWTQDEENLYLQFVTEFASKNPHWLDKESGQKRILYFKEMSEFIGSRSAEQCRSKDQKMQDKIQIQGQRRCLQETPLVYPNINQSVMSTLSKAELNNQNRSRFSENSFEPRNTEEVFASSMDSSFHNVDIYFNFGSKESLNDGLRYDFDDNTNYF